MRCVKFRGRVYRLVRDKIAADGAAALAAETCVQVRGVNRFARESKVQYYVKTFVDLALWPSPAAFAAVTVWRGATDQALAGATR